MHFHRLNREGEHGWWVYAGRHARTIAKGWWSGPWRWHRSRFEVEFALGGEDGMAQVHLALPFVGHIAIGVAVPRSWLNGWIYERREWSITGPGAGAWGEVRFAHDRGLDGMADYYRRKREQGEALVWSRAATWPGWEWRLRPRLTDRILGRVQFTTDKGEPRPIVIDMPEGEYQATIREVAITHKRPRSPRAQRFQRWDIDIPQGLPVPGKGENSWDCGEDAIYGSSFPQDGLNVAEAIAYIQADALRTRARYGGANWRPKAKAAA